MVGLRDDFSLLMYFVLNFFMCLLVNEGLMLSIACIWRDVYWSTLSLISVHVSFVFYYIFLFYLELMFHGSRIWSFILLMHLLQVIMMLAAGHFRIRSALPKPVWTYPFAYISFHTYAIQVYLTFKKRNRLLLLGGKLKNILVWLEWFAGSFGERVPWGSVCGWRSEEYIWLPSDRRRLPDISRYKR